jgi:hypothetical protein
MGPSSGQEEVMSCKFSMIWLGTNCSSSIWDEILDVSKNLESWVPILMYRKGFLAESA